MSIPITIREHLKKRLGLNIAAFDYITDFYLKNIVKKSAVSYSGESSKNMNNSEKERKKKKKEIIVLASLSGSIYIV